MYASYPPEWDGLRARCSATAKSIRDYGINGAGTAQQYYSQIRYSDDQDGISVWVRRVGPENPWMPLKRALTKYEAVSFPPSVTGSAPSDTESGDDMEVEIVEKLTPGKQVEDRNLHTTAVPAGAAAAAAPTAAANAEQQEAAPLANGPIVARPDSRAAAKPPSTPRQRQSVRDRVQGTVAVTPASLQDKGGQVGLQQTVAGQTGSNASQGV